MENKKLIEKSNIKTILIVLALLIAVIPLWYAKNQNKEVNKTSKGTSVYVHKAPGITKEETYEGLKFTNIKMTTKKGYTTFNADVTNITNQENKIETVSIDLKDKNGKVVRTIAASIRTDLKPNETDQITSIVKGKFKNVVSKSIRKYVEPEVQEDEIVEPEEVETEESQDM